MAEYFQFWRFIPKLILGAIITLELTLLAVSLETWNGAVHRASLYIRLLEVHGVALVIAGIAVFITVSSIGVTIADILLEIASTAFHSIRFLRANKSNQRFPKITLPIPELTHTFIIKELDYLMALQRLRVLADNRLQIDRKKLESYLTDFRTTTASLTNYDFFRSLIYQRQLTQEQRRIDLLAEEIKEVQYVGLAILLAVLVLLRNSIGNPLLIGGALMLEIPLLFAWNFRRNELIYTLAACYLDTFAAVESADVSEREGAVIL
jgi:hypothetical protein